jgi:hypothetical protein
MSRKCGYCNQEIFLAPLGFSGIKKTKFCHSCWSRIYTVYKGMNYLETEPEILKFIFKIKKREV